MAVGIYFQAKGVTQAQYDQVREETSPNNVPPPGMLYHVGGPTEDGWRVVEVWDSQESLDKFFQQKLGAALQRANITVQPEQFKVHNTMQA